MIWGQIRISRPAVTTGAIRVDAKFESDPKVRAKPLLGVYTKPAFWLRWSPPASPFRSGAVSPITLRPARSRPLVALGLRLGAELQRATQ
jgi:hypothetical protein